MIIFGTRTRPKVLGGLEKPCEHCRNKTIHAIVRVTSWFTLYFIPLIPYHSKLFSNCNACGARIEFKGKAKEKLEGFIQKNIQQERIANAN